MAAEKKRILVCAAVLLACCPGVSPAATQELIVGQVSSQTSPVTSVNAKGLYAGINVYFSHVNAQGGIHGRMVKLVNKDDQLAPGRMTELTREFIADKNVMALAGYQNTAGITELAKLNVAGEGGIAMISPFQGDRSIVSAPNFFPFRSGYPDEVAAMVREAAFTQKKRVAIVYQSATFGPSMLKLAQDLAAKEKLSIVAEVKVETAAADKLDASVREGTLATAKAQPDAVLLLMGGRAAPMITKEIRLASPDAQLYLMSVVPSQDVYKGLGERARGVIITQAVPFPFSATMPLVSQYQKLMKLYAPGEPLSFTSLEGFITAKITAEALKRAGSNPTREKVLKALTGMGEFDLGGVFVDYSAKARNGWGGVDLTIIGENGKLLR
jgi:branched-chain amino acid transport system substrate-binding protein